jgi:hypothetical protein
MPNGSPALSIEYPSQFTMQGMKYVQEIIHFPYFVRFENYANDLSKLFNKLHISYDIKDLQRKTNGTPHEHYSHYYCDDEKTYIAQACGLDLQLMGYTFKDERKT